MTSRPRLLAAVAALLTMLPAVAGCQLWPAPGSTPETGASVPPSSAADAVVLRVTTVADGDTFTGKDGSGRKVKVRILSIDAPELAHDGNKAACGSKEAAARLRELVADEQVRVVADPKADAFDRYGRRLGYLELDGRDIGLKLIEEGLVAAWYPSSEPRPQRFEAYSAAERTARDQRAGSWDRCPSLGR